MFNTKANGGFDQMIIDRIMDLFRVQGLIPKLDDKSAHARDFEPSHVVVASFHQIRKNCHDLCLGVSTPEGADLIDRYLKLTMTLSGENRTRSFGIFMDSIAAQIASGKNPDFDTTGWPEFQPQGYNMMNTGLRQLFQMPALRAMEHPSREIMEPMGKAIQAMYRLNDIELRYPDISNIVLSLIHQGITDPAVACATVYKNHYTNSTQPMKLAPERGNDLHFVKLVVTSELLKLNPFDTTSTEEITEVAERIIGELVANPTFTRDEVVVEFKKDQSDSPVARIQRVVWTVLMKERMEQKLLRRSTNLFSQALMQKAPEFDKATDHTKAVTEALAELRSHISHYDGGTLDLLSREAPIRQLGDVEVSLESNAMGDEPADSALLADSALMLAGFEPIEPKLTNPRKVELEGYHFEREDDFHVITREYGVSPQGNALQGAWVCRNYHTGEYIDHDRYRVDLFERLNVSRLNDV